MSFLVIVLQEAWHLLMESATYVIFGLLVSGLLRVFLSPASVAHHLGEGRFKSVFKAAFLGVPIPLCSCGVLPAAASLKRQGANNGATTAFLISTPESGVDSIAITYALLDPIMTVVRPVVAFVTALTAGLSENIFATSEETVRISPDLSCPVDGCCSGQECSAEEHRRHHTFFERISAGLKYAFAELWSDLAGWFLVGLIVAGIITALIPEEAIRRYMGGGLSSMFFMLAAGIPLYICATASTPIAAAMILKGVSPGAALVFLIAGPATNVTSITVLLGILGKRAAGIYLSAIALSALLFGMLVDQIYAYLEISAQGTLGQAAKIVPTWIQWVGALLLLYLSVKPVSRSIMARLRAPMDSRCEVHKGVDSTAEASKAPTPTNLT